MIAELRAQARHRRLRVHPGREVQGGVRRRPRPEDPRERGDVAAAGALGRLGFEIDQGVEINGLIKEINQGIILSWPIKISQFKSVLIAGSLFFDQDWIKGLNVKMQSWDSQFTLYFERDGKRHELITITRINSNDIVFNAYGRFFDIQLGIAEILRLNILLPIRSEN